MKAMILNTYGETSVFEAAALPTPTAKAAHVVVKIAATSVNTVDTMIRVMGSDLPLSPALPAVLGMDFAGTITEVGQGVTGFAVGDEVYGCAGGLADLQGALAEFMAVDAQLIALKPKSLTMEEAASVPLVALTAWQALFDVAKIKSGDIITLNAITGDLKLEVTEEVLAARENATRPDIEAENWLDFFAVARDNVGRAELGATWLIKDVDY